MFDEELGKKNTIVMSLGGRQLTGKNAILTEISMNGGESDIERIPRFGGYVNKIEPQDLYELNLTFMISPIDAKGRANIIYNWFEGTNTIKNKIVKDCSIRELLFAVRKKVEEQK